MHFKWDARFNSFKSDVRRPIFLSKNWTSDFKWDTIQNRTQHKKKWHFFVCFRWYLYFTLYTIDYSCNWVYQPGYDWMIMARRGLQNVHLCACHHGFLVAPILVTFHGPLFCAYSVLPMPVVDRFDQWIEWSLENFVFIRGSYEKKVKFDMNIKTLERCILSPSAPQPIK